VSNRRQETLPTPVSEALYERNCLYKSKGWLKIDLVTDGALGGEKFMRRACNKNTYKKDTWAICM